MLPKKHRLSRQEFKEVLSKGRSLHTESFVFSYNIKSGIECPQIGVIASLKVSKKATARNRAKRILKAAILEQIDNIQPEAQIILIAKQRVLNEKYKSLREELATALEKTSLLK